MKINLLVFANRYTGWGHWFRSIALADHLQNRGHQVTIISDYEEPRFAHHQVPYGDQTLWRSPLMNHPDWLVVDLPDEAPAWLYDYCQAKQVRTCVLNGVGHQVGDQADLRIVQGLGEGEYSGVDYIILRPQVFEAKKKRNPQADWFVFGGAADKMNLTEKFPNWQRVVFKLPEKALASPDEYDNGFLHFASLCRRACVAMGVSAWELTAIGVPTTVFSLTPLHLEFALEMQRHGYIKAWHKVGLPDKDTMIDFLSKPVAITGKPIDGRACERILRLMKS